MTEQAPLKLGDTITLGGVPLVFLPQTVGEREELEKKRQAERPAAMWPSFLWLTVFQILTAIQLILAAGEKASPVIPICFLTLTAVMWLYAAALRLGRCVGFELETIAFYLSTLSLAVTASSAPGSLPKQLLAIVLGMGLFLALGLFLRDLERVKKLRWLMAAGAIGLLGITLVLGRAKFGATNWITFRRTVLPALGDRQNLLYFRRLRYPGAAVPQPEPDAVSLCSPACASACWG